MSDRSDMLPREGRGKVVPEAQPAAGIMEERVPVLEKGARGSQEG